MSDDWEIVRDRLVRGPGYSSGKELAAFTHIKEQHDKDRDRIQELETTLVVAREALQILGGFFGEAAEAFKNKQPTEGKT